MRYDVVKSKMNLSNIIAICLVGLFAIGFLFFSFVFFVSPSWNNHLLGGFVFLGLGSVLIFVIIYLIKHPDENSLQKEY